MIRMARSAHRQGYSPIFAGPHSMPDDRLLKDGGYRVLPLDEALRLLQAKRLPPRSVTITFDDGFYDFHRHAVPLLEEFNFPATVFLSTYYCRFKKPVFDIACAYGSRFAVDSDSSQNRLR